MRSLNLTSKSATFKSGQGHSRSL